MIQLIYASRMSPLSQPDVELIVAQSQARNAARAITGALIYTGQHFAQLLEGPASAVEPLFDRIVADPRHQCVTIVDRCGVQRRMFSNWHMLYSGRSFFADRQVRALLHPLPGASRDRAREKLLGLFRTQGWNARLAGQSVHGLSNSPELQ